MAGQFDLKNTRLFREVSVPSAYSAVEFEKAALPPAEEFLRTVPVRGGLREVATVLAHTSGLRSAMGCVAVARTWCLVAHDLGLELLRQGTPDLTQDASVMQERDLVYSPYHFSMLSEGKGVNQREGFALEAREHSILEVIEKTGSLQVLPLQSGRDGLTVYKQSCGEIVYLVSTEGVIGFLRSSPELETAFQYVPDFARKLVLGFERFAVWRLALQRDPDSPAFLKTPSEARILFVPALKKIPGGGSKPGALRGVEQQKQWQIPDTTFEQLGYAKVAAASALPKDVPLEGVKSMWQRGVSQLELSWGERLSYTEAELSALPDPEKDGPFFRALTIFRRFDDPIGRKWRASYRRTFGEFDRGWGAQGFPLAWPADNRIVVDGRDLTAKIKESFALAPVRQFNLASHILLSGRLLNLHERLLRNFARDELSIMSRYFVPVSRGEGRISQSWWKTPDAKTPGWHCQPLHLPDQNRHPSLRFSHVANGRIDRQFCICVKGGGMLVKGDEHLIEPGDSRVERAPILLNLPFKGDENTQVVFHKLWGGMHFCEGSAEALNLLKLWDLMTSKGFSRQPPLPILLDLGSYLSLPVWDRRGRERWLNISEYEDTVLRGYNTDGGNCMGYMRTLCRSDVRLSQIVNRIFQRPADVEYDLDTVTAEIDSSLAYLYAVNGETYRSPDAELRVTDGSFGSAEIGDYLVAAGKANRAAAKRIERRILGPMTRLLGAVHGAHGHLGGTTIAGTGAISGGAVAMRNVDAAGTLHDLDGCLHLPWMMPLDEEQSEVRAANIESLKELQWLDLVYFKDTAYWVKCLLHGRPADATARELIEHELSPDDKFLRFGALEDGVTQFSIDRMRKVGCELRAFPGVAFSASLGELLLPDDARRLYNEGLMHGADFVDEQYP